MKKKLCVFFMLMGLFFNSYAQKKMWRYVDLRLEENKGYRTIENELPKVILEGVREGKIRPYNFTSSDMNFSTPLSLQDFEKKTRVYNQYVMDSVRVYPADLFHIELQGTENKKRFNIQHIALFVSDESEKKIAFNLAIFQYNEVKKYIHKLFKKSRKKQVVEYLQGYWYDANNPQKLRAMSEALDKGFYKTTEESSVSILSNPHKKLFVLAPPLPKILSPAYLPLSSKKKQTTIWRSIYFKTAEEILKIQPIEFGTFMPTDTVDWILNKAFQPENKKCFVEILLDGVKSKAIQPYHIQWNSAQEDFNEQMTEDELWRKITYQDDTGTFTIDPKRLSIELKEYLTLQTSTAQTTSKIAKITLVIPIASVPDVMLGDLAFAEFKWDEVKKYVEHIYHSSSQTEAVWTNPTNPTEKMSMTTALEQGKFFSSIFRYSNFEGKFVRDMCQELYNKRVAQEKILAEMYEILSVFKRKK